MKYKCHKCGLIVVSKREIPIEHGTMSMTIHPNKPKPSKECDGLFYALDSY